VSHDALDPLEHLHTQQGVSGDTGAESCTKKAPDSPREDTVEENQSAELLTNSEDAQVMQAVQEGQVAEETANETHDTTDALRGAYLLSTNNSHNGASLLGHSFPCATCGSLPIVCSLPGG
jgi:hypothetical protein